MKKIVVIISLGIIFVALSANARPLARGPVNPKLCIERNIFTGSYVFKSNCVSDLRTTQTFVTQAQTFCETYSELTENVSVTIGKLIEKLCAWPDCPGCRKIPLSDMTRTIGGMLAVNEWMNNIGVLEFNFYVNDRCLTAEYTYTNLATKTEETGICN